MKTLGLLLFSFAITSVSLAQYSVSGQIGLLNTFRQTGLKNIGVGIKGHYTFHNEHLVYTGSVNYYMPSSYNSPTYVDAIDSNITSPSQQLTDVDYNLSFVHITIGTEIYVLGSYEDDFGLFLIGDGGGIIATVKRTVANYDHNLYTTTIPDYSKGTLMNATISLGLGVEKKIGSVHLFLSSKWNLTIKTHTNPYQDLPSSLVVNGGIRFPLTGWF